ncbi:MAG: NAD(P)H-quinone oxidoreductase [Vulcanimicrobiota bacterium]
MQAIVEEDGKLILSHQPNLTPGVGEVLIATHAAGVNRADLVQRQGHYPPPPGASEILGLECSGRVEQVGAEVDPAWLGREVCALLAGGGYASQVVCPVGCVLPVPERLSLTEAAALPEVFATAYLNLKLEGQLKEGERVLVHAGASGVGTAAISLCAAWGNPIFVTVGSADKENRCRALGAQQTANRHEGPWGTAVRAWGGADVILDPVGASYLESNIFALRPGGRLVNIGLMGGREGTLPLGPILTKRLTLKGSVLRSRSVKEKTELVERLAAEVWPLIESGQVSPVIDTVMPLQEAEQAHLRMSSNLNVGKILLKV